MATEHLIYIHGFNSSPLSFKARQLKAHIHANQLDVKVHCPELSHWPEKAMQQLIELIKSLSGEITLVGSSLGGFYSTALLAQQPKLKAVLVNPAVAPHRLLPAYLGDNENLYSGERYQLTLDHMHQLEQLYLAKPIGCERMLVLLQTADETLNYLDAVEYYAGAQLDISIGGSHGYDQFENKLAQLLDFADIDYQSPLTLLPAFVPAKPSGKDQ